MSRDELEERVSALETTVGDMNRRLRATEHDAAAARVMAGAADRDVGEIKAEIRDFRNATTAGFNAMRADFLDLRQEMERRFEQVDRNFERVDRNFEQVDRNFIEMRGKFDATAAGQQHIADLIQRLIDDQDR